RRFNGSRRGAECHLSPSRDGLYPLTDRGAGGPLDSGVAGTPAAVSKTKSQSTAAAPIHPGAKHASGGWPSVGSQSFTSRQFDRRRGFYQSHEDSSGGGARR